MALPVTLTAPVPVTVINLDASHALPARSSPSKIGRGEGWSFLPDNWSIRQVVLWE